MAQVQPTLVTRTVALMIALGEVFSMTRLQAPVAEMVSLTIGLQVLVTRIATLVIEPPTLVARKVSLAIELLALVARTTTLVIKPPTLISKMAALATKPSALAIRTTNLFTKPETSIIGAVPSTIGLSTPIA